MPALEEGVPAPPKGVRPLTPLGLAMLEELPPILRESPDYQGVIHPLAKACEQAAGALEIVRRQFNPSRADVLLGVWERTTRQTREPPEESIGERQTAVVAHLRKMLSLGQGFAWEEQVTALIGTGWTYEEHIPGDESSPAANTLRIKLPFPPESARYLEALAAIREVTPAHLDIVFVSEAGFLLDESRLDLETLTI